MPYPSKALQEYALKSEVARLATVVGSPGPAGPAGAQGSTGAAWAPSQSPTAPAVPTSGTIATAGFTVTRVAPTSAVMLVVLEAGTVAGQRILVLNESAFALTFGNSGTSNVSIGTSAAVPPNTACRFIWNSVTRLWYPAVAGAGTVVSSNTYGGGSYSEGTYGGASAPDSILSGGPTLASVIVDGVLVLTIVSAGTYGAGNYGDGSYGG